MAPNTSPSCKIGWTHCSTRRRANREVEIHHAALVAAVVTLGMKMALPVAPEANGPQDGADRQDCERNAVKRWLGMRKPVRHIHRYRWASDLPLRDGPGAMPVSRVGFEIVACGRVRWRLENYGFNVMKSGCGLERNSGQGKETLSSVLLMPNLVAFAIHTGSDLLNRAWQERHRHRGSRRWMFELIRSALCLMLFGSWDQLMASLATQAPLRPS